MKWQIETPGLFYDNNEEFAVYFDSKTGNTHLVSELAAHLIRQFADRPLDLDDIIEKLSLNLSSEDLPELPKVIPNILNELFALDIVENV